MQFGMTGAKTWHVIRDDGSKVCGSGGKVVMKLVDSIFVGNGEWVCAKCEFTGIIQRESYSINKICNLCRTVFNGSDPYSTVGHKHFAIKDEHRG